MDFKEYLFKNLPWKVYPIDETSGIVTAETSTGEEFSVCYSIKDTTIDTYTAISESKARIVNDVLNWLQPMIDGLQRVVLNPETGELENITWSVTKN